MMGDHFVRAKIVCTIGPSSDAPKTLLAMAEARLDIARINFSHGNPMSHKSAFDALEGIDSVSTLLDLPGPKIRLGEVDGSVYLANGTAGAGEIRRVLVTDAADYDLMADFIDAPGGRDAPPGAKDPRAPTLKLRTLP